MSRKITDSHHQKHMEYALTKRMRMVLLSQIVFIFLTFIFVYSFFQSVLGQRVVSVISHYTGFQAALDVQLLGQAFSLSLIFQTVVTLITLAIVSYFFVLPATDRMLQQIVRQNHQLREVDALKTEFLSVSSHQLRTPLAELKWALTLLRRRIRPVVGNKDIHYLRQALQSVDTMSQIVAVLLNVSRIEQNRLQFNPHTADILPIIRGAIYRSRGKARDQEVTMHLTAVYKEVKVNIDVLLMKQIFQNLIDNAIQYNRSHGKVMVLVKRQKSSWLLSVSDTGYGMSSQDLKHIFTKFYRGEHARRMRPDGSGLGLYFVKRIVEKHRGKITVTSKENIGTTVTITLPFSS